MLFGNGSIHDDDVVITKLQGLVAFMNVRSFHVVALIVQDKAREASNVRSSPIQNIRVALRGIPALHSRSSPFHKRLADPMPKHPTSANELYGTINI